MQNHHTSFPIDPSLVQNSYRQKFDRLFCHTSVMPTGEHNKNGCADIRICNVPTGNAVIKP